MMMTINQKKINYSRNYLRRTLIKRTVLSKEPKNFIWQPSMKKFDAY